MNKPRLIIELVPETCWYANLRKFLSQKDWDTVRRATYKAAGYKCEICGGVGPEWPVECHEIWYYDEIEYNQILIGLQALCPACHQVKHIGLATIQGKTREASEHLQVVNGWDSRQAGQYIWNAFDVWEERSNHSWTTDTSWITREFGIELPKGKRHDS